MQLDELFERLGNDPAPMADRIPRFFAEDWVIRADGGEPLVGRIVRLEPGRRIERDEITGEPLPVQPEDAEVVVRGEFHYSPAAQPVTLSIRPPIDVETGFVSANIGFVVYHLSLPVNDFRYLGQEETLDLDWGDPWYSRFRNRNLRRQFDAPLSAFLYVEHFEVRKEIIIRPKDLQDWIDLGLSGRDTIYAENQEEVKRRTVELLAKRSPVTIDGREVEPASHRIHFVRRTLRRMMISLWPRTSALFSIISGCPSPISAI